MDSLQIRQAIREVQSLKQAIVEKQRFRGYSGRARALGGGIALGAALGLTLLAPLATPERIFAVWGVVFVLAASLNYGALCYWLARGREPLLSRRVPQLLETCTIWLTAGVISLALWLQGEADLLYGLWMMLFGLAQIFNRHHLPRGIGLLGAYYLLCGGLCLWWADGIFARPLAMGAVFFVGEFAGGLIFHVNGDLKRLRDFFRFEPTRKEVLS
ncbi:MAG: hypothetical protein Q7P63_16610 [Verrucomicrobiota bacterium JB022]|nr:hypothetical protein [Verrucomicrobiota bacterium JB022]